MTEQEIIDILYRITQDSDVLDPDCELLESGILDSLAFIELFTELEDRGIELQPTQIDRTRLRTVSEITKLVNNHIEMI